MKFSQKQWQIWSEELENLNDKSTHPHSWITNNRNMSNCLAIPIIGISKQFIPLVPRIKAGS